MSAGKGALQQKGIFEDTFLKVHITKKQSSKQCYNKFPTQMFDILEHM